MEIYMMENGKMVKKMDMVYTPGIMDQLIKEIGKII